VKTSELNTRVGDILHCADIRMIPKFDECIITAAVRRVIPLVVISGAPDHYLHRLGSTKKIMEI